MNLRRVLPIAYFGGTKEKLSHFCLNSSLVSICTLKLIIDENFFSITKPPYTLTNKILPKVLTSHEFCCMMSVSRFALGLNNHIQREVVYDILTLYHYVTFLSTFVLCKGCFFIQFNIVSASKGQCGL